MKNYTILISFIFSIFTIFSQGLILDKENSGNLKKWAPSENFGYAESYPSKISFRAYTPPILNQGQTATCVGYAVAYGLLTTQQNVLMGITNENMKYFRAMDPNFVYSLIKSYNDSWCQKGSSMYDAIGVLINSGCKPMFFEPWLECNSTTSISKFALTAASIYSVNDAFVLDMGRNDVVNVMKSVLNDKRLIAIGAQLTESFQSGTTVKYGSWFPTSNEPVKGGHAMVIIGYDDNKNGGSFEVMNSWGASFGDKGFVWIKYADAKKYIDEAYVLDIDGFSTSNCSFGDCTNSVSRFKYSSGNVYEGLIINSYPDIYGSYYYYNTGNFYVGEFSKGKKHGYGVFHDNSTNQFFLTYFQNDVLVNKSALQGFSEDEEKLVQTLELYEKLNQLKPAKLIKENDSEFEILLDMEIPVEDLQIPY